MAWPFSFGEERAVLLDEEHVAEHGVHPRGRPRRSRRAARQPLSERSIPSGAPVGWWLELNGGVAKKIGLQPGDHIELH